MLTVTLSVDGALPPWPETTIELVTLPASCGLIVLGNEVVQLLFAGGKFTADDVGPTVLTTSCLVAGLPFIGLAQLYARAFYAVGDNGTPADIILPPFSPQHAKRTVYEQGIRVPLLALGRGVNVPGRRSSALVHAVDLWRTIGEAAGANIDPAWPTIDSVSFGPVLHDPDAPPPREYVYAESFRPNGLGKPVFAQQTIVHTRYKYIVYGGDEQFYDLENDPLETDNKIVSGLSKREQRILADMQATMAALLASA